MSGQDSRLKGRWGEDRAAEFLRDKGYRITDANWQCRFGEIDLIAEECGVLVFLEVKYRKNNRYGSPAEAVTSAKQRTICRVADFYRMSRRIPESQSCRFDVVAIQGEQIEIYKDAFSYG